jgi:hypothetical protein
MEDRKDILEESMYDMGRIVLNDGVILLWSEYSGLIPDETDESKEMAEEIRSVISIFKEFYSDESSVPITPEGPYMTLSETDPVTISYLVTKMYGENVQVMGDLYTLRELGLDYASNFDEYGNEIVR